MFKFTYDDAIFTRKKHLAYSIRSYALCLSEWVILNKATKPNKNIFIIMNDPKNYF